MDLHITHAWDQWGSMNSSGGAHGPLRGSSTSSEQACLKEAAKRRKIFQKGREGAQRLIGLKPLSTHSLEKRTWSERVPGGSRESPVICLLELYHSRVIQEDHRAVLPRGGKKSLAWASEGKQGKGGPLSPT